MQTAMLFRSEVQANRSAAALGRAVPLHASDTLPIVGILLACVAGLAVWLVTGSYSRSEIVPGWVVPAGPTARILPAQRGTLVSLNVTEGQRVAQGERLGAVEIQSANEIASDPAGKALDIVKRQRAQLGEQQRLAELASGQEVTRLRDAAAQMRLRLAAIDRQLVLQRTRVASARSSFAIISDAARKKYISRIDFENQRRGFIEEQARLESLTAERATLQTDYIETLAALRKLPIQLRERTADLAGGAMALEQQQLEIERNRAVVLEAPIAGQVSALQARVGQSVGPQIPVMYVLGDEARMEVELFAPSRAIGFARIGQEVRLMYDAFPYQQFGSFTGTIAEVSRSALRPDEIEAPVKPDEPTYRLRIRLDRQAIPAFGRSYAIQPGMTLKANLILERQSFLDWLLEPINAVRNRA
jgi:membrane fusion protein